MVFKVDLSAATTYATEQHAIVAAENVPYREWEKELLVVEVLGKVGPRKYESVLEPDDSYEDEPIQKPLTYLRTIRRGELITKIFCDSRGNEYTFSEQEKEQSK